MKDPILTQQPQPDGIELLPLREPESLDMPSSYVPSTGALDHRAARIMTVPK